ncbi:hypothetical protein Tco_1038466 [Tanacetum coccineum]
MFSKLACMTNMWGFISITGNKLTRNKRTNHFFPGMPEVLVPRSRTDRQQSMRSKKRLGDKIQISRAITSEKDMTGQEILH